MDLELENLLKELKKQLDDLNEQIKRTALVKPIIRTIKEVQTDGKSAKL